MIIVYALKHIYDGNGKTPDLFRGRAGSFDPRHGSSIDLGKDDLGFCFGASGTMLESSELLFSLVPPLVEGAAAGSLPGREMSSQISEVGDNLNAAVDMFPESVFEPPSDVVRAGKVVAFIGCYLRPPSCASTYA